MKYYIAGCVFTAQFPELSGKIREYIASRGDLQTVRCCVPGWRTEYYEEKMPPGPCAQSWRALPQSAVFSPEDSLWSLCPNCLNIAEEWRGVREVHSLWELLDQDDAFPLPDYSGACVTLQDCWRLRDRSATHGAVRSLLSKMNLRFLELPANREKADFCGKSLYRPQVARNPQLAPKHYRENAAGLFEPHTEEEQTLLMREYCRRYETKAVVCSCHYCLEGILAGGANGLHIAQLLFDPEKSREALLS